MRFRGDGTVLDHFEQLIDPRCPLSPGAMAVNGISAEMVAGQPLLEEVLPAFTRFLGTAPLLMTAYNAAFDLGFLNFAYRRLGLQKPSHLVFDTLALARRRLNLRGYSMEKVGRSLNLAEQARHRALADALLLKDIFLQLTAIPPRITSPEQLLQIIPGLSFDDYEKTRQRPPPGFEALWEAMGKGQPVQIHYLGGSSPGSSRLITPLGASKMNGRIQLTALCHKSGINKSFRLDRITSFQVRSLPY